MPLSRYASECERIAKELANYLSDEDHSLLRETLSQQYGWADFFRWRRKKTQTVSAIVAAAPAARAKILGRYASDERRLLVLAAIQHCVEAADLLVQIERLQPGISYRDMAAAAGEVSVRLQITTASYWPFIGEPAWKDYRSSTDDGPDL